MTDPRPLIENEADAFERELLRAASADAPSPGARARTLAALGIGGAVTGSAAVVKAAAVVGDAAGSGALGTAAAATGGAGAAGGAAALGGGAATPATVSGTALIAKWIGVGVVAGAVTAGTTSVLSTPSAPDRATAAQATVSPPPSLPPVVVSPPVHSARAAATPAIAEESRKPTAGRPSGSASPPLPDVAAEVRSLSKARDALERGLPHAALAALAVHEREFGGGVLAPEVELMRIDALVAAGQRERAESSARAFLARNAKSPHASRVRALLSAPSAAVAPTGESPEKTPPAPPPPATASFPDP